MQDTPLYQFGDFVLDANNMRLMQQQNVVSCDDKIVKALALLCAHYPEAIDKDSMLEALWPSQVVTDWSLSKLISEIRHVLGDNGKDQDYIKTVRGQGFRMNTPVVTVTEPNSIATATIPVRRRKNLWYAALGVVFIAAGLGYSQWESKTAESPASIQRIAVLPVSSEIESDIHDWVEYGVMAMIAEQLSQYPSLRILPIEKVITALPQADEDPFEAVCGQLGCNQLVQLTFTLDGNRPHLAYSLIDAQQQTTPMSFASVDVIDVTNQLVEALAGDLIPRDQDIIPLSQTFSSNAKANRDYAIGVHELLSGEYADAKRYLTMAGERETRFFWAQAYLAELDYRMGNFEEAAQRIEQLSAAELNDEQAYFLQHLHSNILYSLGDINESLAVTLALKTNPFARKDPLLMGNESLNIGSSLQALGRNQEAIPQLLEARDYYQQAGYGSGEGKVLFNLANVYLSLSEMEKAAQHYQLAKDVFIRFGLTGYALFARHQLATTNLQLGKVQNAENELHLLIDAYQENGDKEGEMTARNDLALVSLVEEDYTRAAQRADEALQGLQSTDFSYLKNHAIYLGAKAHLMLHDPVAAQQLLAQLEGDWMDTRPSYIFIPAHLEYEKGNVQAAIAMAQAAKIQLGEQWTEVHEGVLAQFQRAADSNEKIELRY